MTIFNPQFGMNIQAVFFLWRKFAPVAWKDRFDPDDYVGLQLWLERYGYAIATLCESGDVGGLECDDAHWNFGTAIPAAFMSAKQLLTGQIFPKRIKWKEQIVVVTGGECSGEMTRCLKAERPYCIFLMPRCIWDRCFAGSSCGQEGRKGRCAGYQSSSGQYR